VQDDDGPRGLERVARPVRWRQPVPANEPRPPFDRINPAHGDTFYRRYPGSAKVRR
jgi:hypothetical protein